MREKILIVEDEFIVANDLRLILERAGYRVCGIASSVAESLEIIGQQNPSLVLLDIQLKGKLTGIDLARQLNEKNIAFVYLSANSNQSILEAARETQPYGFLVKPFREKDVLISLDIARYRHEHSLESKLRREILLQNLLEEILVEDFGWDSKMLKIVRAFQSVIPFDYLAIGTKTNGKIPYIGGSFLRIGFDEYQCIGIEEFLIMSKTRMQELKKMQEITSPNVVGAWYDENAFQELCIRNPVKGLISKTFGLKSNLDIPLMLSGGGVFNFSFFSRSPAIYNAQHLELLTNLKQSLEAAADGMLGLKVQEIQRNNLVLREVEKPVRQSVDFEGIVGSNHALLAILDDIAQVAPFDTSVLILGESGTGKERVAYSVHHLSPRKTKPFVKINCAALPANLIESELFGHEKGAFTGASERRIGKFEQASGGTIFLDEIGEMPLDMQVKLLRVLQEKEIERIGGKTSVNVNVRIIAATNRNLEKEVAEGRFRLDLYYRLNVFPVQLPPLRERKDDIEALSGYFVRKFCSNMNKNLPGISAQMMSELHAYHWPGNIRELENIIEQSIILSDGKSELVLKRSLAATPVAHAASYLQQPVIQTFDDVKKIQHQTEREYLISVLRKVNGRIRGDHGAAKILSINPTTLESRINKLGIKREDFTS